MAVDEKILGELRAQTLLLETIIALLDANKKYGVAAHLPYTATVAREQTRKTAGQ
jgi:hypothetical protein